MSERKKKIILAYTDGSCVGNGNRQAVGGIGIHFPNGELKDISKIFDLDYCTNQRAELYAILTAIRYVKKNLGLVNKCLLIKTDSKYSIDCVTDWIHGWMKNGWMTKNNTPVHNKDLIELIYKYCKLYHIRFQHVDAHTERKDPDSVGNKWADILATNATKKALSQIKTTRHQNFNRPSEDKYSSETCQKSHPKSHAKSHAKSNTKKSQHNTKTKKISIPSTNGLPRDLNFVVELVKKK